MGIEGVKRCTLAGTRDTRVFPGVNEEKKYSGRLEIRHNPELVDLFAVELLQELIRCMRDIL